MNRKSDAIVRCTVERLMRRLGLTGTYRGKVKRTTIADSKASGPMSWPISTSTRRR